MGDESKPTLKFGSRPADNNDSTADNNETQEQKNESDGSPNVEGTNQQETRPEAVLKQEVPRLSEHPADPTASQLGIAPNTKMAERLFEQRAAIQAADHDDGKTESADQVWSCHPMQNFVVGKFRFENSVLRLGSKDTREFEKLIDTLPLSERNRIFKIDANKVGEIVKARAAATQLNDSSIGKRELQALRQEQPEVATDDDVAKYNN